MTDPTSHLVSKLNHLDNLLTSYTGTSSDTNRKIQQTATEIITLLKAPHEWSKDVLQSANKLLTDIQSTPATHFTKATITRIAFKALEYFGARPRKSLTEQALHKVQESLAEDFLQAVTADPSRLPFVPDPMKTPAMCQAAVARDPSMLEYVSEYMRTPAIYEAAVTGNPYNLLFVPDSMKTPDMCAGAVASNPYTLRYVPDSMKTPAMCQAAVASNPSMLQYIPDSMKNQAMCAGAVASNPYTLRYVPDSMKTPAIYQAAVARDPWMLQFVPEFTKTQAMCAGAVASNPYTLRYVPDSMKTPDMCQAAVARDPSMLQYVPDSIRSMLNLPEYVPEDESPPQRLIVNLQQLRTDPVYYLNQVARINGNFKIEFENQLGVDSGGLSRQFTSDLCQALITHHKLSINEEGYPYINSSEDIPLYINFGKLLSSLHVKNLHSPSSVSTGRLFFSC
jgi:hypothetical protein